MTETSKGESRSARTDSECFCVLLIDDSATDRLLIQRSLEQHSDSVFDVTCASSLAEGLAALADSNFNAVLLDLTLPDSERLESCDRIVEEFPDIPVVVLTGMEDRVLANNAVEHGAQDFLSK